MRLRPTHPKQSAIAAKNSADPGLPALAKGFAFSPSDTSRAGCPIPPRVGVPSTFGFAWMRRSVGHHRYTLVRQNGARLHLTILPSLATPGLKTPCQACTKAIPTNALASMRHAQGFALSLVDTGSSSGSEGGALAMAGRQPSSDATRIRVAWAADRH